MLLSVIIPIYKVEPYIRFCLDSLLTPQPPAAGAEASGDLSLRDPIPGKRSSEASAPDYEVLMVDDGSPDGSADIAREYAERDPEHFQLIEQENGGHGSAWNTGLARAQGEYVLFLDSDDAVTDFPRLLGLLRRTDADLVLSDKLEFTDDGAHGRRIPVRGLSPGEVSPLEEVLGALPWRSFHFHTCIYKRALLSPFHPLFAEHCSYDDIILFGAPLLHARTCMYTGLTVYRYRLGRDGQSMDVGVLLRKIDQYIAQGQYLIDFLTDHPADTPEKEAFLRRVIRGSVKPRYDYILKLPRGQRKPLLDAWTAFVRGRVSWWRDIPQVRWHACLPYPLFRIRVKLKNLAGRIRPQR